MVEERDALDKHKTWDIVELLTRRKLIGSKLVFKKKLNVEGKVENYKSHLVAKGYSRWRKFILVVFFLLLLN